MTDPDLVARFALAELVAQRVDAPSLSAIVEQARRVVAAGRGVDAGLHLPIGVVAVEALDGELDGWRRGEGVLDVLVEADVDPVELRGLVEAWLGAPSRILVRVRVASGLDRLLAWARWLLVRRRVVAAARAVVGERALASVRA